MKRALAERAKQSGLPNGVASPLQSNQTTSENSIQQQSLPPQPLKIPRLEAPRPVPSPTTSSVTATSTTAASPRTRKRQRPEEEEDEQDDSNFSAFYLRHQNRALASELRSLRHQMCLLERERDYRRRQTTLALQSLNSLQATWTQLESALHLGQPPIRQLSQPLFREDHPPPPSTGKSVELVGALLDTLASLGTAERRADGANDGEETSSSDDERERVANEGESLDLHQQQPLDDLLKLSDNVAQRASMLQQWVWSLLAQVPNQASYSNTDAGKLAQKLAQMQAKYKLVKQQLKELARSREEMEQSERRVRRGLYRLAAGRVQLKEVLKAIERADEDEDAAAAWMEVASVPPPTVSSCNAAIVKQEGDSGLASEVDSALVAQLQQQVKNLEQVAAARDEQIQQVSIDGFFPEVFRMMAYTG